MDKTPALHYEPWDTWHNVQESSFIILFTKIDQVLEIEEELEGTLMSITEIVEEQNCKRQVR